MSSTREAYGFCPACNKRTKVYSNKPEKKTNHILHLLLSIVTLGVWLLVWALLPILTYEIGGDSGWRCVECGNKQVKVDK